MAKKRLKIGVLFGGKSAEHEVSLHSAKNVINSLDKNKYEVVPIGIDKSGRWLLNNPERYLLNDSDHRLVKLNKSSKEITLYAESRGRLMSMRNKEPGKKIDVIFPLLHGPFGEDGSIQGLLKVAGIPFVGAGVLGSAVGMDKEVMKRLLKEAGIAVGKFMVLRSPSDVSYRLAVKKLGKIIFVKPANLGSSVGIHKVHNENEWKYALKDAFLYDTKVLAEEFIDGRELAVAVLGNERPRASKVCEIITSRDFYDYEAKYSDEHGAQIDIPAKIPNKLSEAARKMALDVYKTLGCEGLARVDLFLRKSGRGFVVCELNTIPGFTQHSMYPKLWEKSGLPLPKLLDKLIALALERYKKEQKLKTSL